MKWYLRFFAAADVWCLIILYPTFLMQLKSLTAANETLTSLMFFSRTLYILVYFSLLVSALFLTIPKRLGLMIYFCQLPLRLIFSVFSFGFISYLNFFSSEMWLTKSMLSIILFAEFTRIFYSYKAYKILRLNN